MPLTFPDRATTALRALLVLTLGLGAVYYIRFSLHWPLLLDSPVMHYVRFLMDHGMRPYREITDNNMPGAYITEGWAMSLFGGTDFGWRLYDFTLLGVLTLAMVVIAWPVDWLAGIYAGGLFTLVHASEGPFYAGQREQLMATLLMVSCALLFLSVRRHLPPLMFLVGFLSAMAASIKPTISPVALFLVLAAAFVLHRRRLPVRASLLYGSGGLLLALLLNIGFLVRYHAVQPFLFILHTITPAYISLNRPGFGFLTRHLVPDNLLVLIGLAAVVLLLRRHWDWERGVLAVAAAAGILSFYIQQKGFLHHRYLFLVFILLLTAMELTPAARSRGLLRALGLAGILFTIVLSVPHYLSLLRHTSPHRELTPTLEADLESLGGQQLQHQVQCFDLIFGCLNSLYHLGLVENTGYTGDLLLFAEKPNVATDFYRTMFQALDAQHPASVYVITNNWFGHSSSFDRLNNWPQFASYLHDHFTLVRTRTFPLEDRNAPSSDPMQEPYTYRIYVRNGSPVLQLAAHACAAEPSTGRAGSCGPPPGSSSQP